MIARHWLPASLRSDLAHRLVGATIGSAGIWAAGTLATLAIGVLLARPLGPEGYGVYGTALAIVSLLGVPATFGLPLLATRELAAAQARGDVAALAGHRRWFPRLVLVSAIVTAAALLGGLAVLGHLIAPHVRMTLACAALLVPGLALCALGSAMLRGLGEVVAGQALDVLARPLLFLAGLAAIHGFATEFTPEGAVAVQAVTSAVVAIGGFWWLGRQWSTDVRTTRPAPELRRWGASAWPLALADGFRVLEGAYGVLLVSALSTTFEAGLLRVALASLALCTAPISLQNLIVAPYLSEAYAQQRMGQVQRIAAGSALFMTMTVGAATLGFALIDLSHGTVGQAQRLIGIAMALGAASGFAAQMGFVQLLNPSPRAMLHGGAAVAAAGNLLAVAPLGIWGVIAGFALASFGYGLARPGFSAAASIAVGPERQGAVAGAVSSIAGASIALPPILAVALYQYWWSAPFVIAAAGSAWVALCGTPLFARMFPQSD